VVVGGPPLDLERVRLVVFPLEASRLVGQ